MKEEQAERMIKLLEQSLDYMKSMHKEMREVKVRISEINK